MELLPNDSVPELNNKNLGNSPRFPAITHMTVSTKQFRSYRILMIDDAAEFCFWTEQRQTDLHVWVSDWPKLQNS
jgi:hypothetical protein